MSGVRGDWAGLRRIEATVLKMSGAGELAAKRAAADLTSIAQQDFGARRTPYGAAWPARAARRGLVRTGALRAAIGALHAGGAKIRVGGSLPRYARYQNPRLFIPSRKLPATYSAAIDAAAARACRDIAEGRT